MKALKKESQLLEIKSTMFKVKDKWDCIYSRLDITEITISESIETAIKSIKMKHRE